MRLTMKITGVDDVISDFKKFGREGKNTVKDITKIKARDIERDAKSLAPFKFGKLRQGIKAEQITPLTWDIVAHEIYSPYIEYGTGSKVSVPLGLEDYAMQFKGKGIRDVSIPPQPFLYPAWKRSGRQYIKDLNEQLERLSKKYG